MIDNSCNDLIEELDQTPGQRDYLLKRADDHRTLALKAVEPHIRSVHLLLQQLYEKRALRLAMIHPD